jgi:hypothetical protein
VFALIGAKVRQVPPAARLGIHSIKLVVEWGTAPGHSERQMESYERKRLAEINAKYRRYVQEMKVDTRLFDLILQGAAREHSLPQPGRNRAVRH